MIIKKIKQDELNNAIELVWQVFLEFEAPDYTEEGVKEFKKTIDDKNWISERVFYGAYNDSNELLGVIATKNTTHIALFFVDDKYHKNGIGRSLFQMALSKCPSHRMTVNSSPYAVPIYHKLGFADIDIEQVVNGLRFTPMEYKL